MKKADSTGTTVFVYDATGKLVAEYTTAPAQQNGTSYITQDHLGSTRVVTGTNPQQLVKARHDFMPYGEEIGAGIGTRAATKGACTGKAG